MKFQLHPENEWIQEIPVQLFYGHGAKTSEHQESVNEVMSALMLGDETGEPVSDAEKALVKAIHAGIGTVGKYYKTIRKEKAIKEHEFEGIIAGTPNRDCTLCGLADRHAIHIRFTPSASSKHQ